MIRLILRNPRKKEVLAPEGEGGFSRQKGKVDLQQGKVASEREGGSSHTKKKIAVPFPGFSHTKNKTFTSGKHQAVHDEVMRRRDRDDP